MDDLFVNDSIPYENGALIRVVGVGGAGGNAVNNMINDGIANVEFISMNTDAKALKQNKAPNQILLSKDGLGAGCNPEVGKNCALESIESIRNAIKGSDLVFITCGMGGGTGTGASPVVAAEAKAAGALTIAVVYMPRVVDGLKKNELAKKGLEELIQYVDSYIVVPNEGLKDAGHKKNFFASLKIADDVLCKSVRGISEIVASSGYIGADFADVRTAMAQRGKSVMGIGRAGGEGRAKQAFEDALKSPLLADTSIMGAYFVLVYIACNEADFLEDEYYEISALVHEQAGEDAHIKVGVTCDDRDDGTISVTIVATGITGKKNENVTRIESITRKTGATAGGITDRMKSISGNDKNLRTIGDINDDIFEIPTYLRKQTD